MSDNIQKQLMFEANRKSMGVTYLLWFFLGVFGAHRFYAGNTKSGVVQLVLTLTFFGLLVTIPWALLDAVLIPGMVNDQNRRTIEMLNVGDQSARPMPDERIEEDRRPNTPAERKRQAMLEELRSTGYRREPRDTTNLYR